MVAGHFTTNFNSDLVVVTTAPSSQLMVFQGMNGGFGPPRTLSSFSVPVNQVVSADLNNDGIGDLVVSFTTAAPQVMLGTFSGQFEVLAPLNVPPATAVAVFDMDGDGLADIVTASSTPAGLSVSRNNGGGSFQLIESTASPAFTQIALGFLDGDGVADLVGCDTFSGVSIAHGVVPGLIGPMQFVTTLPAPANAIGLVDGNGNGLPDALFATSAGLFLVDGVTGAPQTLLTISSTGLAVADLNGDGLPDVATLTDPGATILRNVGAALVVDGTAQTSVLPPGLLTFAELNGTARPELVAASSLLPVLTSALNTTP
jgi:hypothetical protein